MDNAYSEIQEGKRNHGIIFFSLMIMHQWSTIDTQMKNMFLESGFMVSFEIDENQFNA